MADLTPGELAKIDQIHAGITNKLAELVSSAVDGIRTEGEALTASALAGTAQATDHGSISALLAASLVLNARYQMADEKRHAAKRQQAASDAEVPDVYATCGHAYIADAGEFTCRRGVSHGGQHWDSLAEFGWDD
jgi:hypothetical protein